MRSFSQEDRASAIATLNQGGILAVPTETVYGLAVRLDDEKAILKLLKLKDRQVGSGKILTIMLPSVNDIPNYAQVDRHHMNIARRHFPGELTLILKKHPEFRHVYFDNFDKVGIRIPAHKYMLDLLRATGPLLVTSANPRGEVPCLHSSEVHERLKSIDGIVHGSAGGSLPSTIIDWSEPEPRQVRAGGLLIVRYH
ncbi:MAG: threonylcarbamoyl-AMP synthase [Candidatus Saccharibacteria bacterium]|nr:threonylcarbamoyl-AMP synthase [Candidatus Saccharibacteria bacterium]